MVSRTKETVNCFMQHCAPTHHPGHQHHGHHHPQHHHQAHHPTPPHLSHHPHHPHHPAAQHHQSHHHHHASPSGPPPPSALHAPPPIPTQQPSQNPPQQQQQQAQQQPQLGPFRIVAAARPEAWATSFTHQGGAGAALRSIPPGPPNNLPPQHHTGAIGGLGPGGGGGAGPQGGGGGGPAQAPTPPGASSHDMAKQGGGLPTQSSHMAGQGHMAGASGMAISFNMSNQPRPSGPQPYSYRPSNSARLVSGRGPVMTQNGVGHMSYQHMPFSQGLQMVASPLNSQAVFTPVLPWYTTSPQQRQPGYIHPATQQQMIFQPNVPMYQYPGSPQGPQSQILFNPILRANAAGASTGGGGGHGGTLPQQQALQQQSPVSLQPQAVVGAGGQVSGLPVGTGGGGPPPNVAMVSGMAPPGVNVGGVVAVPGGVGGPSATQQPQSKPRKNAIPILDPDTGHDVVEKMLADEASQGAASGSSSCTESSTQDENMKRKKEFAAQIYKVAKTPSESATTPPPLSQPSDPSGDTIPQVQASGAVNGPSENLYSIPSENVGPNQLGMNVASEPWKQVPDKEILEPGTCESIIKKTVEPVTKSEPIREEKDLDSAHIATSSVPEAPQPPVVSARGGGIQVPVPLTVISAVPMTTVPIVTPPSLVQVGDVQNLAKPGVSISSSKEPVPVPPLKHPEPATLKSLTVVTQKSNPNCTNHTQKGSESSVVRKMPTVSREASSERKAPVEASPIEEDKNDEKPVEQMAIPIEEPLPQRVQHQANGEDGFDSKATQRGKQKKVQKNRELNRKGAEKEGTDMDAFSDAQLQQQRQDTAATSAISEEPVNSQRIEPFVPTSQPGEVVVNEVKSRTETPPPPSHLPSSKASVILPMTSERGAVNAESPSVNVSCNYPVKSELHPLPSSEPGIDNKKWGSKMSSVESSSSERHSIEKMTDKVSEAEKEVAVEKATEENSQELWKLENTNQVNEDSSAVEKDLSSLEKVDQQDEIVAVKNSENKMVSSVEIKKSEDDSSCKMNSMQDVDMGTVGSTPVIENVASELAALTLKNKNFYKEDQWSPMNPTGKKKYERDFLLHLKSDPQSMKKPDNLPDLEIVLNRQYRPVDMKSIGNMSRSSQQDFAPLFVKPSSRLPAKRNSQQGKPKVQRVMLVSLSLNEDVKLHVSENAWKPRTKAKEGPKKDEEELYAAMRGILNKLTPQNFEKLVAQVMKLPIDTMEKLKGVIDLVFDKAVDEPNFSVAYAELCNSLNSQNIARQARKNSEESSSDFRKILLKRCQCEFEKDKATGRGLSEKQKEIDRETSEERKKELRLQMEDDERRMRRKSVGVIRFIGELFKLGMINQSIMVTCIKELLEAGDEESLECLCKLLTTVGKVLEETLEKKGGKEANLNVFFERMKMIVGERKTSSRVRFMLQDAIDLKNSRWVPRRDESNPKKMEQIAMEAERETMEMQKMAALFPPNPPRSNMGGGMGRKEDRGKPRAGGSDLWQTVPSNKNAKITVDPGKLKAGVDPEIGNLGPNNSMIKWGMGASGGSAGLRPDKKQNTYQILNEMDSPGSDKRMPRYKDSSGSYTKSGSASFINSTQEERARLASVGRKNMPVNQPSLDSSRLRSSPKAPSRDSSVVPDDISRSSAMSSSTIDILQSKPPMDPDLLQRLCKSTIDEYKSEQKMEEVLECLKTEIPPVNYSEFLCICLDRVLETSPQIRQSYGRLVVYLIKNEVISKQLFMDSLQKMLSVADETIIDVPKFWEYFAEILAVLFEEGTFGLSALRELTSQLQENNLSGPLVLECLKVLFKDKGPGWIREKWKACSLQWSDLMAADKVADFVNDSDLVYVTGGSGTILPPKSPSISMEEVKRKLNEILRSKNWDNDQVFAWIKGNVGEAVNQPQFIRALTTAIFESAIEKDSKLKVNALEDSSRLIQKYITTNEQNELQCLYAIQALVNRLEHPKGLIFSIFENLMSLDLITGASFRAWEVSPNEPDGKAVALKSLSPFFIYLNESEDIDSNED